MDAEDLKEKMNNGSLSDRELNKLLNHKYNTTVSKNGGFLKTVLKGFNDGYTTPVIYKLTIELVLILVIVVGLIFLSYTGHIDPTITAVLLATILGFLFGKI